MQLITRFTLSLLIALATCFGAFALVGCGGSSSSASASAASSQSASAESTQSASAEASSAAENASSAASDTADNSDEEQDNCYGDDLPAKKQ